MPTLAAPLDFAKLEGRQVRIHQLSVAPASPVTGQEYYNTTDNTFYWWNGTTWRSADASSGVGGPPTGAAGGDLLGSTYPNPIIAALAVTDTKIAAANKDGAPATPSMRTLGTGAAQACAGNDSRLSDTRTPIAHHTTHEPGGSDPMAADAVATTASLRTVGVGSLQAMAGNTRLDTIAAPLGSVSANGQKITNLNLPTVNTDAANKQYVDSIAQGLDVKNSCRAASTANLTLTAPGATIDGVTMVVGDRVLCKDQTTQSANGIYVWQGAAATMTRDIDADASSEVTAGMFTFIEEGTVNGDSGWILTTNNPIVLGTTALTFAQFSGAGQVIAGAGLTKTGNSLDVVGTFQQIVVNPDSIGIDVAYRGQVSIDTLGTISAGTWGATATPIGVNVGGTGQTTAKAGRETGLVASGYYSSAIHGAGTTISITQATHLLRSSRGLLVQCQIDATGAVILPDIAVAANGDVTVTFSASQTANTIRTTIIG